ncbi:luciferin 4-monooxygenase-like [Chironomus tepperi]|uniref:luciferin 4-monooxygenase-like n=1 Tax=Chironomus tepperi TaxID=113505 RepID=UPI00391F01A3
MQKPSYDPVNKIWHGPKIPPIYNPDQNLGQLILKVLQQTPDSVTQISADTGVTLTCQQMYDRSVRIAKYLTKCGMKEGDLIGLVTANTENLAPVVFACFTLGLPINPLSPIMNEKDIVQMFTMTKPKMIFCDADNVKVVQNAVDEMKSEAKVLTVMDKVDGYDCATEILKEMESESVDDFEFQLIDPNSTAAILCSSGSTGFPKGICKSHKQFITDFSRLWPIKNGKTQVTFQASPIFWLSGFLMLVAGSIYRCIRVITTQTLHPEVILNILNKYSVSVYITQPYTLVALMQLENFKPIESIQCMFIGGSVISSKSCEEFKPFIPNGKLFILYGSTEENFLSFNNSDGNFGSSGFAATNVQLKVVDRKKELLKYKNYQVTPSEIEAIINEIPGITTSCVVGVPEPNTGNDIIHAFVIADKEASLDDNFILNYVNSKVIDPKRIRGGVHIVDAFPLGLTGKVDRKKVRDMVQKVGK